MITDLVQFLLVFFIYKKLTKIKCSRDFVASLLGVLHAEVDYKFNLCGISFVEALQHHTVCGFIQFYQKDSFSLNQGSGTFLGKRAIKAKYF